VFGQGSGCELGQVLSSFILASLMFGFVMQVSGEKEVLLVV
jgi:hypothetical protein